MVTWTCAPRHSLLLRSLTPSFHCCSLPVSTASWTSFSGRTNDAPIVLLVIILSLDGPTRRFPQHVVASIRPLLSSGPEHACFSVFRRRHSHNAPYVVHREGDVKPVCPVDPCHRVWPCVNVNPTNDGCFHQSAIYASHMTNERRRSRSRDPIQP